MARKVFYSFDYEKDLFRVQQVRNMGVLEGNRLVSMNKWEAVKKGGRATIQQWIDQNMAGRTCLIVLVGERTYRRQWVRYEIKKAWNDGKGVFGIYIHNLRCLQAGYCSKGPNPFDSFTVSDEPLSAIIKCYNPKADAAYKVIRENIEDWIEKAIEIRNNH